MAPRSTQPAWCGAWRCAMRSPRSPVEIDAISLFQAILAAAALVTFVAGAFILGGEQVPGLDLLGLALVVAFVGVLAAIAHGMQFDHGRKVVTIRIPLLSDRAGPDQGFDPRAVDAARSRAVDKDGNPKIG